MGVRIMAGLVALALIMKNGTITSRAAMAELARQRAAKGEQG